MNLTIGIPAYNNHSLLKELLTSLASFKLNFRILVVDDGSTTPIPKSFQEICQNIIILEHQKNLGLASARNTIIKNTTTELLLQLDVDCFPTKEMIEDHLHFHQQYPNLKSGCANQLTWHPDLKLTNFHHFMGAVLSPTWKSSNFHQTFAHFYGGVLSCKTALLKDNLYDENFKGWGFEDTELSYRLYNQGIRFQCLDNFSCYHKSEITFEKYILNIQKSAKNLYYFYQKYPFENTLKSWIAKGYGYLADRESLDQCYSFNLLKFKNSLESGVITPPLYKLQSFIYSYNLALGLSQLENYETADPKLITLGVNYFEGLIKELDNV